MILGKRKHAPPCSSEELFFAEKKGGHRGKISVVDMALLVFIGFFVINRRPGKFFCEARKSSPKDFLSVVVVYVFFSSLSFASGRFAYFQARKKNPNLNF